MKLLLLILFPVFLVATENPVHIIPAPAQITYREGFFKFGTDVTIIIDNSDSALQKITGIFFDELLSTAGIRHRFAPAGITNRTAVRISLEQGLQKEGYTIEITTQQVSIAAADAAGLFYAFQSLRQLMPVEFMTRKKVRAIEWKIPCVSIVDYPRFGYRGMHLDVSRHFFSIDFLKKYLDILAFYKINTFHWHLTDSHGWRLEIKKYPRLTSIGAWRADRTGIPFTIAAPTAKNESPDYGGFYTQQEVLQLIRYAKERFITIIPEIEMPGHCTAALVAYPEYTCLNNPVPLLIPCGYPGDLKHNFCPGNDSTFIFLQNILDEVIDLFPSEYIHIGGDEVRPASWLNCPRCRKKMNDEQLGTAKGLQSYFTKRIDQYITAKNRKLIGWDEIMEGGISQNAAVMSWRGNEAGIAAAKSKHQVVMAPYRYVYFDFYQSPPSLEENISYAGLQIDKVYSFDPMPAGLNEEESKYIMGAQACLWTENISTPARVEYMLLPRMLALSEVLWTTSASKNYERFINNAEKHFAIFDARKINYSRSMFNVTIEPEYDSTNKTVRLILNAQTGKKHIIRYCTTGKSPSAEDPIYAGPIEIKASSAVTAALFGQDTILGKTTRDKVSVHKALGAHITSNSADSNFSAAVSRLADGIHGTIEPYDNRWVFTSDTGIAVLMDLQEIKAINKISFSCMEDMVWNMYLPAEIRVLTSADGKQFEPFYAQKNLTIPEQKTRHIKTYEINHGGKPSRYLKFEFVSTRQLNPENPAANNIFIDELVVE